jgi:predicted lipid-binding transport protein (Tim44 family)
MIRRRFVVVIAAIVACFLIAADAHARAGGGFSGGSRGTRTFSAPPATQTAPNAAAPMQRTLAQPGKSNTVGQAAPRPGLFGGGLLGGLAAGFLGAGLFGLLFGHGLFGGMGGFASFIGLMLQIALVVIVARLLFVWWQRRNAPAPAYAAAHPATGHSFSGLSGMLGGNEPAAATIEKSDYDEFERLLGEIQTAYSDENINALRGLVNKVSDVRLEQGDLAEAWNEGGVDYATVAMRFALTDRMVERASGRAVEGGVPGEATELWTFMRARHGSWLLSAIQQT